MSSFHLLLEVMMPLLLLQKWFTMTLYFQQFHLLELLQIVSKFQLLFRYLETTVVCCWLSSVLGDALVVDPVFVISDDVNSPNNVVISLLSISVGNCDDAV